MTLPCRSTAENKECRDAFVRYWVCYSTQVSKVRVSTTTGGDCHRHRVTVDRVILSFMFLRQTGINSKVGKSWEFWKQSFDESRSKSKLPLIHTPGDAFVGYGGTL